MFDFPFYLSPYTGFSITDKIGDFFSVERKHLPFIGTARTHSNERVTIDKSLKIAIVWACVNIRAKAISSMPIHLKNQEKQISKHPLNFMLHQSPNAMMTAQTFWSVISTSLDLNGNAYIKILHSGSLKNIIGFQVLNPQRVVPTVKNGKKRFIVLEKNDKKEVVKKEYSTDEIIHIMGLSRDGIIGLSPIEYAAETIGDLIALEKNYAWAVSKSLKAAAVLDSGERPLSKDQKDELQSNFAEFMDFSSQKRLMILSNGQKLSGSSFLSLTPQTAQIIENRNFGVEEICRAFGVPPALVGHTEKTSTFGNSLENTMSLFMKLGLNPTLVAIEQAFEKALFSILPDEMAGHTLHFNRNAILQADTAARFNAYHIGLQDGIITTNEARDWEDLPPSDDENADKLRVQLNMTTLENLGKPTQDSEKTK